MLNETIELCRTRDYSAIGARWEGLNRVAREFGRLSVKVPDELVASIAVLGLTIDTFEFIDGPNGIEQVGR